MLGELLKSKFYKKCKSATELTKKRLDIILKKRNATKRFLKNDIALLLKNGSDRDAYCRAGRVLVDQNLTYCYELVEKYIEQISTNVSIMDKESECPEDCREAVSSLIFAAARFGTLPELAVLKYIFTKRYGTSLDSYVNTEFVDKLKLKRATKDMKLQLLQDIAEESSVQWDRNDAENKLLNPLPQGANSVTDDKSEAHRNGYESPHNRTPSWNIPRGGRKEVDKDNLDEGEIFQDKPFPTPPHDGLCLDQTGNNDECGGNNHVERDDTKPFPVPPYRRSHLDQTGNNDERVTNNRVERDDEKLRKNPVRKSNPISITARKVRSKFMCNEDEVGVLANTRK